MEWNAELYKNNSPIQFKAGLASLELLKPTENENILDIGCGDGRITLLLSKQVSQGTITAIDASGSMIDEAQKNASEENVTNVHFLCMDAHDIAFVEEFDAVFSNYALHLIKNLKDFLGKIHETLKPGGRLVATYPIGDAKPSTGEEASSEIPDGIVLDDRDFESKAMYEIACQEKYRQYLAQTNRDISASPQNARTMKKALEKAGFSSITIEPRTFSHKFEDINAFIDCERSASWVFRFQGIPVDENADFETELAAAVRREYEKLPEDKRCLNMAWLTLLITAIK